MRRDTARPMQFRIRVWSSLRFPPCAVQLKVNERKVCQIPRGRWRLESRDDSVAMSLNRHETASALQQFIPCPQASSKTLSWHTRGTKEVAAGWIWRSSVGPRLLAARDARKNLGLKCSRAESEPLITKLIDETSTVR